MTRAKLVLAGTVLLLALAWLAYLPGLRGGFLFDDYVNLVAIGATGPVDDLPTLARYLTSGIADPTGRPLALASFLLDARDWPAEPAPFLRTNLVLHLLNGLLLLALLRRLGAVLAPEEPARSDASALLGAGLWLLHPLLVSTTLYIVQRESMLAATFCFAGLLGYVAARQAFDARPGWKPLLAMAVAIAGGTALAMLCKANGVLLPMLALVLEGTVLRRLRSDGGFRQLRLGLLVLPSVAVVLYLASFAGHPLLPIADRGWSVSQRLLTESRALVSYLSLLVAPRVYSPGLYNDAFVASTGLLEPWTTLPSLLIVAALAALAWRSRESRPRLAAGLGFFLSGHLLESSTIPLELYFEHRNYLPAALLFWPVASAVVHWRKAPVLRGALAALLLLGAAWLTRERASVWSQPELLAKTWAVMNPGSSRAQATAAMFDTAAGRPGAAMARLAPIWRQRPGDVQIAFNYVDAACNAGGLSAADAQALGRSIREADAGIRLMHGWLSKAIDAAAAGSCAGMDLDTVSGWVAAMAANPGFASAADHGQEIEPLLGKIALARGDRTAALSHFDRALSTFPTPDTAARQAAMLASAGAFEQALAHLDHYAVLEPHAHQPARGMPYLHAKVLAWQGYWPAEMAILRRKLRAEIDAGGGSTQ